MKWICSQCGIKHGTKKPDNATWHAGVCSYCNQKQYITEPRDYGIIEDEPPDVVKDLFGYLKK